MALDILTTSNSFLFGSGRRLLPPSSFSGEKKIWIFQKFNDPLHKFTGHNAVYHTVVSGQAQVHHGTDHDLAVAHNGRIHDVAYTQNRQLRLVMIGEKLRTP